MITGTISQGVINIVLGGYAQVQKQLASVRAALTQTAEAAKKISTTASVAFASASASVLGFARVADPLGSLQLDIAFARVSVQLGRFFIPLLHQATDAISRLADYLGSLSDSTRETVLQFTKWGLAISGVLGFGVKLAGVLGGVASVLRSLWGVASGVFSVFWRILGFLGPWGRLIVIVGSLAAALVGITKAGEGTSGVLGKIVAAGKSAWEALKNLWGKLVEVVGPAIAKAATVIESAWGKIVDTVSAVWEKLSARLGPPLTKLFGALGDLFATFGPVVKAYVERWGRDFERFGQLFAAVLDKLSPVFGKVFSGDFVGAVESAINTVTRAIERVKPYAEKLAEWLVAALESDTTQEFADGFRTLTEFIGDAIAVAAEFGEKLGAAFAVVAARVQPIRQALSDVWDKATSKTTSFLDVLRELAALAQSIGQKIGDGFNKVLPYLEKIAAVAGRVFDDLKTAAGPVVAALSDAFERVAPVVEKLFDKLVDLGAALIRLGGALREFFGAKLAEALNAVRPVVEKIIDAISAKLEKFFKLLAEGWEAAYPTIKRVIDAIGAGFVAVINYIRDKFYDFVEGVTKIIDTVIAQVNKLIDGLNKVNPGKDIPHVEAAGNNLKRPEALEAPEPLPDLKKPRPVPQPDNNGKPVLPFVPVPNPSYKPPQAEQAPAPREKPLPGVKNEKNDQGNNKFVGQLLGGVKITGIAEAMRAAQQATVPTRETAILEEIARANRDGNAHLKQIEKNTGEKSFFGLK